MVKSLPTPPRPWSRRSFARLLVGMPLAACATPLIAEAEETPTEPAPAPEPASAPYAAQEPSADATAETAPTCGSVEDDSMRTTLEYVDQSVYGAVQDCRNCEFWIPVEEGQSCGGCTLIAGPISPLGWCTAWAPAAGVAPAAN